MNFRQLDQVFPSFAQTAIHIRSKDEPGFVPFRLNAVQKRRWQIQLGTHRRRFLDLKARQQGLSTLHQAKNLQRAQVIPGFSAVFIAHRDDLAEKAMRIVKDMYARQPAEVRAAGPKLIKDDERIMAWDNGSSFEIGSARAFEFGRGSAIHSFHGSEFAWWPDPKAQLLAVLPAIPTWGECSLESTPQGHNHFYELCKAAQANPDTDWEFCFFPWWESPENRLPAPRDFRPTEAERLLMERHALDAEQIMFRRRQVNDHGPSHLQEQPEDAESCFLAVGDSLFGPELVAQLQQGCQQANISEWNGMFQAIQPPHPGVAYSIGVDCAEGVPEGDYSAASVIRSASGANVATFMDDPPVPSSRDKRVNTTEFAAALNLLGRRYNTAALVVELNGPGHAVLNQLVEVHEYPNLYAHDPADWTGGFGREPGFRTNRSTKSELVGEFRQTCEVQDFVTFDVRLPRQMADYVITDRNARTGYERVGARPGAKDDLLMAAMLGNHGRTFGRTVMGSSRLVLRMAG